MRWEDERYVRLYTRDTATWRLLPWQAKCVLPLILRKVDRAGVMDLGDTGYEGVAALLEVPLEVVEPGLAALVSRGVVRMTETAMVMPKFLDAQEVPISDAARKRESRERALAKASAENDSDVTRGHERSHEVTPVTNVTFGHESVTPSRAVPSRAVPSRAEPSKPEEEAKTPPPPKRPDDQWASGEAFFAWLQCERVDGGYVAELPPNHRALGAFFSQFLGELNGDTERALATVKAWLRSAHWKEKKYPFASFMKLWREFVPRKTVAA